MYHAGYLVENVEAEQKSVLHAATHIANRLSATKW